MPWADKRKAAVVILHVAELVMVVVGGGGGGGGGKGEVRCREAVIRKKKRKKRRGKFNKVEEVTVFKVTCVVEDILDKLPPLFFFLQILFYVVISSHIIVFIKFLFIYMPTRNFVIISFNM